MSYGPPTFDDIGHEIHQIATSKGWTTPTRFDEVESISTHLCLIHSEVSEALEAVRDNDPENFAEELADIMIRTIHLAHGLGVNLDSGVRMKIEKNRGREYQHGGKRI